MVYYKGAFKKRTILDVCYAFKEQDYAYTQYTD